MAAFTAFLLAAMLFSCGVFSVGFILAGGTIPVALGICLGALCLLGAWSLYQEINFGRMAERVSMNAHQKAAADNPSPCVDGSKERDAKWMEIAARNSGSYEEWYYLSIAHAEAGDRKKARAAMREAIELYKKQVVSDR